MQHSGQIGNERLRRASARRPAGLRCSAAAAWRALLLATLLFLSQATAAASPACRASWPLWDLLTQHYLSDDGRIIDDAVATQHSTSESQSYGMFFALVANDRQRFDLIWEWSLNNLLGGELNDALPAWQWGLRDDGEWGVLDGNAASDANLWFSYALLEAGRLWSDPGYTQQGLRLARLAAEQEWVDLPGFGPQLLPGPTGFFDEAAMLWRLNPSYLVIPQLRLLARLDPAHDWQGLAAGILEMIRTVSPRGLAPDWTAYHQTAEGQGGFVVDPVTGDIGSYDAIRTYLWAGLIDDSDPVARPLRHALYGMTAIARRSGWVPEKVSTLTGASQGTGPAGFEAALVPLWATTGQYDLVNSRVPALRARFEYWSLSGAPRPAYYDMMLAMFGLGWYDQHYRFAADGSLLTRWENSC